jgi:hypothetical protein
LRRTPQSLESSVPEAMKGLVIQLSADAANSLRRGSHQQSGEGEGEEEDWNDVIPLGGPSSPSEPASALGAVDAPLPMGDGSVREGGAAETEEETENDDDDDDDDDDDEDDLESVLSRTPPASLPALRVDLEKLVGYPPRDAHEVRRLSDEVAAALGATGDQDFEARVAEMLGSNIARHATTSTSTTAPSSLSAVVEGTQASDDLRYATIPYPKAMILPDGRNTVVTTSRLWKRVTKPHRGGVDVVNRLLVLLAHCGRPLTWKAAMRREVLLMARDEERRMEMAEHEFHRSDQLRKLYGVRETIESQLNDTSRRVQELEGERDAVVQQRLALQRLGGGIGIESTDALGFGFDMLDEGDDPDEEAIALSSDYGDDLESDDEFDDEGESQSDASAGANLVSDNDDGSQHGDSPSRQSTMDSTQASTATEIADHRFRPRRRRRSSSRRAARLQQEKIERSSLQAAEAARARREKEAMQRACTTQELAAVQAVLHALERKLHQVDELLETLQDEEWKKEEEREERGYSDDEDSEQEDAVDDPLQKQKQLSLLDEILAMILGATPPPLDSPSMDDHVAWMRNEHREIVRGWKEYFGRLPPPLRRNDHLASQEASPDVSVTQTTLKQTGRSNPDQHDESTIAPPDGKALKEQLKQAFGIEDKDVDHWEEGADDDVNTSVVQLKAPGLRPQRGRHSRR